MTNSAHKSVETLDEMATINKIVNRFGIASENGRNSFYLDIEAAYLDGKINLESPDLSKVDFYKKHLSN